MVKEVEFSNVSEVLGASEVYSNAPDQPLFDGYLTDNALSLNIVVHSPLRGPAVAQRKLFLFFGNIDFDNRMVDYLKLEETDFDFHQTGEVETDRIYTFDLSRVLIIPRKIYSTGGTSEIVIELYTYEANINTDYGTKRLSVPYTIESNSKYEYDKSTDGVYKLVTIDFDPWTTTRSYGVGDIVESDGELLMSLIDNNDNDITEETWTTPTDEDIIAFGYGNTKYPSTRSFVTDILLSRYAKYELIRKTMVSTSFKEHDDDMAYELTLLLQNLRERAKFKLMVHKPIDAAYNLQLLKLASSPGTDTTKIHTYNIKYTT